VTAGERFLDHLAAAIRIPTVSHDDHAAIDHAAFDRFGEFLERTYPATFARLEVEAFSTHARLLTWRGSDPGTAALVLMAHQDVVPVEDESAWSHHPFEPTRTATHLIGRGAIDDKGSLIAILEAVEALLESGTELRRTLVLALGHDEERMGADGAGAIASALARQGITADLVLDEGGFITERVVPATRRPVALVGVSEKGYLDVELSVTAAPGHSSAPPRVTAVGAVAAAVAELQKHPLPAHIDRQAAFFAAAAAAARPPLRQLIAALPRLGRLAERLLAKRPSTDALIRTTTAPTMIEGGIKANVLPSSARALVNFRILPGDTTGTVIDHVRSVVGDTVTVVPHLGWDAAPVSDLTSTGYRALEETIAEVFPDVVVAPWIVIGATDARYFSTVSETVLRFLPFRMDDAELSGFHGDDERIRLGDAEPAVRFYRRLIERMCL
jgi:carboxypeptidase PM20D1